MDQLRREYLSACAGAARKNLPLGTYLDLNHEEAKWDAAKRIKEGKLEYDRAYRQLEARFRLHYEIRKYALNHPDDGTPGQRLGRAYARARLDLKYLFKDLAEKMGRKPDGGKEFQEMSERMDPKDLKDAMEEMCHYICSEEIALNIWIALHLQKPLLVEGPPGCGKTALAGVLSEIFGMNLIRLQCYEGVGAEQALYEWNYSRQILDIQRGCGGNPFSEEYLLERPLLQALRAQEKQILLIDEIDKADEEFEAFLLEILSDFQVSIPELGTIKAERGRIPIVILTSNTVRDLGDALRRRCVYLWIDFPSVEKEAMILMKKVKGIHPSLALSVSRAMQVIRNELNLIKQPSVSESLDLASALVAMQQDHLDANWLDRLSALFIKNKEDMDKMMQKGGGKWVFKRA